MCATYRLAMTGLLHSELWSQVLNHLGPSDRCRAREVCRRFSIFEHGEPVVVNCQLSSNTPAASLMQFLLAVSHMPGAKLTLRLSTGQFTFVEKMPKLPPHFWEILISGVCCRNLRKLSLDLKLTFTETQLLLTSVPDAIEAMELTTHIKVVADLHWARLQCLSDLILSFLEAGTAVHRPEGIGRLLSLETLQLSGPGHLAPDAFNLSRLTKLSLDSPNFQSPGLRPEQLPSLQQKELRSRFFKRSCKCPSWLQTFPLHALHVGDMSAFEHVCLKQVMCEQLRISWLDVGTKDSTYRISLSALLTFPRLRHLHMSAFSILSTQVRTVLEGTRSEAVQFIKTVSMAVHGRCAARVCLADDPCGPSEKAIIDLQQNHANHF